MKKYLLAMVVVMMMAGCTPSDDIQDNGDLVPAEVDGEFEVNLDNALLELDLVE